MDVGRNLDMRFVNFSFLQNFRSMFVKLFNFFTAAITFLNSRFSSDLKESGNSKIYDLKGDPPFQTPVISALLNDSNHISIIFLPLLCLILFSIFRLYNTYLKFFVITIFLHRKILKWDLSFIRNLHRHHHRRHLIHISVSGRMDVLKVQPELHLHREQVNFYKPKGVAIPQLGYKKEGMYDFSLKY